MGLLDQIGPDLAKQLIEEYGSKEAAEAGLGAAAGKSEGAFNAPSLKVGETPVTPSEFGQVASAQTPTPSQNAPFTPIDAKANKEASLNEIFGNLDESKIPRSAESAAGTFQDAGLTPAEKVATMGQKAPIMTPVKEELPQFGEHLNDLSSEATPGVLDKYVQMAKDNKLPATLGMAGLATAGMAGDTSQQAQNQLTAAGPESAAGANVLSNLHLGQYNDPGADQPPVPLLGTDTKYETTPQQTPTPPSPVKPTDNESEDESDETGNINKPGSTTSATPTPSTPALPQAQSLAQLLATDKSGGSYKDMQQRSAMAELGNQLGSAANIFGSALARAPVNEDAQKQFAAQAAQAANMPKEFVQQKAAEELDPSSAVSQNYRAFLKSQGLDVGEGVTAQQIKDVLLPAVDKEKLQQERLKAAADNRALQLAQLKVTNQVKLAQIEANRQQMQENKDRQFNESHQKTADANNIRVGQQLESVRGNKALQNDLETIRRVQNFTNTVNLYPDTNQIPADVMSRLNQDMGVIFAGGVAGEGVLKDASNPTMIKSLSKAWSNVMNEPTGAQAKAFVTQNQNIINELGEGAKDRYDDKLRRQLNTAGKSLPTDYRENYKSQYLPYDTTDKSGNYIKSPKAPKFGQSSTSQYSPGSTVMNKKTGQHFLVGSDGTTLTEL